LAPSLHLRIYTTYPVTEIDMAAFKNSADIVSVTIPNSVTSIYPMAFDECPNLNDVTVSWPTPLPVYGSIFDDKDLSSCTLHAPSGTKALYQADEAWGEFGTILETTGGEGTEVGNINDATPPEVTCINRILTITSASEEQIEVYSMNGILLYNACKAQGATTCPVGRLPKGALIVKGSSGWTRKIMLK
jgi:hypothetical protein